MEATGNTPINATDSPTRPKKKAAAKDWKCQECGKRFTLKGAERASSVGCSGCGGSDIDLAEGA